LVFLAIAAFLRLIVLVATVFLRLALALRFTFVLVAITTSLNAYCDGTVAEQNGKSTDKDRQ
jgi:hypothetical protein